jgi:hypothetical protein
MSSLLVRLVATSAAIAALSAGPVADTASATLGIAGRGNAAPTVAALDRVVAVAWGATAPQGSTDVYVAVSHDGARTFGPPLRVNDVDSPASVGGEQPPRVVLVPRGNNRPPTIVVVWTAKSSDGTTLLAARSENSGETFTRPRPIAAGPWPGNRGWESTAVDRNGHVMAVWLDHRELAGGGALTGMHHEGHGQSAAASNASPQRLDGAGRAQASKLYFSRVNDGSTARPIASGVCYCCKTAVATAADGSIYAAWRQVYPGNLRDIAFSASHDEGRSFTEPIRVSQDGWALDGCPENGPALAVSGRVVHVVWPTLVRAGTADGEESLALFYAASSDGRGFTTRRRLPTHGTPRHPQITALANGSLVVAWDEELEGGRRRVAAATVSAAGAAPQFTPLSLDDRIRGEYPVVAGLNDGAIVMAWVSGAIGQSVIRVAAVTR